MKAQILSFITLIMLTKLKIIINIEKVGFTLHYGYSLLPGHDIGDGSIEL